MYINGPGILQSSLVFNVFKHKYPFSLIFYLGCFEPLGMESHKIKDSQLSSKTHDSGWDSSEGRLNNGERAWCSDDNTVGVEYFDIDLLKIRHVSAIATQGVRHLLISYYVKTYVIMYSFDQGVWFSYQDGTGNEKVTKCKSKNTGKLKFNLVNKLYKRCMLLIYDALHSRKHWVSTVCLISSLSGFGDLSLSFSHKSQIFKMTKKKP